MTTAIVGHANGATRPRQVAGAPLVPSGPFRPWPRATAVTPPPGTELLHVAVLPRPDKPAVVAWWSRLRAVDGDTVITWAMAATVALVAVDAAIVSYSHIYGLATGQWGSGAETGVQARLLPLSIDGIILEASLVKLYAARHKLVGRTRLATFMLWLGIVATVAANVTHGLPSALLPPVAHVVIMALLSAWPAGALIGSVEMAMGLVRSKRAVASASDTEGDSDSDKESGETAGQDDSEDDTEGDTATPRRAGKPRRVAARKVTADPVAAAIGKGWDDAKIVAKLGVSLRTVQRRRVAIERAKQATANPAP